MLELLNYRVTAVPDGAAALAELLDRQLSVDLIVSDVVMPRLDGINLVKALQRAGRQIPVVLMTGYTADGERAALQHGEVAAWVDKPLVGLPQARSVPLPALPRLVRTPKCVPTLRVSPQTAARNAAKFYITRCII